MHFTPSGLEICFSSVFYSNQLQFLISPHLPVPNSTTSPILLLLCLSTFVLFTFMTPEGTSNSLFTGGEGMNVLTRHVFPELHSVRLSPFNDMYSSVCQFQEQLLEVALSSPCLQQGLLQASSCRARGMAGSRDRSCLFKPFNL